MNKFGALILASLFLPFSGGSFASVKTFADLRTGYFSIEDTKQGKSHEEGRLRLRGGFKSSLNDSLSVYFRAAGRAYLNDDNEFGVDYLDSTPAYSDSIPAGQVTVDSLFLKYSFSKHASVRFGRFQSSYELKGVAKKSLDRNNSPNTDIAWTDGVHLQVDLGGSHRLNTIIQYNSENGSSVLRKPLSFLATKSRLGLFVGLEHTKTAGPFVQRQLSLTVLPYSLCESGVDKNNNNACKTGDAGNYIAATARVATQWPLLNTGGKFLLGTELGYSPTTPTESAIGGSSTGDADGLAYQATFNLMNFIPKHNVGLVIGKAGGGWLVSPDFSSNYSLKEIRYVWKFAKKQKLALRFRQRETLVGNSRTREDWYLRYTVKF